ncbi:hypothetical protein ABZS86_00980 [Streptomyces sp. NPDC005355]|uniref:hypothetical protein n=1 Tax=Streptomyces sp. NPDC005355 TaxID=3157038 RepID=UPI0033BAA4DE
MSMSHPSPGPAPRDTPRTPASPGGRPPRSRALLAARRPDEAAPRDGAAGGQARRGPVDPVRGLMHRHRELCARAVDPLEIAAGLEAHGVTDRTAARFRHRDVFSLAEELYARVPRAEEPAPPVPAPTGTAGRRMARGALWLLPGALCAATVYGLFSTEAAVRIAVAAVGAVLVAVALWRCLCRGPLRVGGRGSTRRARLAGPLCAGWLLSYAACGDWLLTGGQGGTPGPYDAAPAAEAAVVLALAVAPAAWCARWFGVRARRRLAASRGLEEFAAGARPLCAGAVAAFLLGLVPLVPAARLTLSEPPQGPVATPEVAVAALGGLFFLARLLAVHGFRRAALIGTAAACAAEAAALATALAARLPGGAPLGEPLARLIAAHGAATVPAAACGAAALALGTYAVGALSRASAHSGPRTHHTPTAPCEAPQ